MAFVDESPTVAPARPVRELSVVDTTELRWFAEGLLPPDIASWFTCDGTTGTIQKRCDTYRLDHRHDIGVKLRFRETLEVKVRQAIGARVELDTGPAGRPEVWRKWSPAAGLVGSDDDTRWVDVHKTVVKRRFSLTGDELVFADTDATDSGCDVEIAAVRVGSVDAWTLAFAAFGPEARRRDALVASWKALAAQTAADRLLRCLSDRSFGYPQWLCSAADVVQR